MRRFIYQDNSSIYDTETNYNFWIYDDSGQEFEMYRQYKKDGHYPRVEFLRLL